MKYKPQKWLNFILSGLWLLIAVLRIIQQSHISVVLLSLAGTVCFLCLGIYDAKQEKWEQNKR